MIDEKTYDELDRYFRSAMNIGDADAFESRLQSDAELRAELSWISTMLGAMKLQGKSVMKQTIAQAIAGVPANELVKYVPSRNKKGFLKKYWWIIAGVLVAVGVAFGIYQFVIRHDQVNMENDGKDTDQQIPIMPDSVTSDSCIESMAMPPVDSVEGGGPPVKIISENVDVFFDINSEKKPATGIKSKNDSAITNVYTSEASIVSVSSASEGKQPMSVIVGIKNDPPYTYSLNTELTLNSPYRSTIGFSFKGSGDTIYMTDKTGVCYMLLRNKGVQPLIPISRAAH